MRGLGKLVRGGVFFSLFVFTIKAQRTGIGIPTPDARFHIDVPSSWKDSTFIVSKNRVPQLTITSTGNVGIGTASPQERLVVSGKIWQINTNSSILIGEQISAGPGVPARSVLIGHETGRYDSTYMRGSVGLGAHVFHVIPVGVYMVGNIAIGDSAMSVLSKGAYLHQNIAIGRFAMQRISGAYNSSIAIGAEAMRFATGAGENVAVGTRAMYRVQGGARNVALGSNAMENLKTGSYNTGVGYQALANNEIGWSNVAVGIRALASNISGHQNTAIGGFVMENLESGQNNVAIGYAALAKNRTGNSNVAIGWLTLNNDTASNVNIAIGLVAMRDHQGGDANIALGSYALQGQDTLTAQRSENIAIGREAMRYCLSCSYNISIGSFSNFNQKKGQQNIAIGQNAMYLDSMGYRNIAIGYRALSGLPDWNVDTGNVAIGTAAMDQYQGKYNTAVGHQASFFLSGQPYRVNATSLGYLAIATDSNQVRIGNTAVNSIGGYAPWSNLSDGRFKVDANTDGVPGLDFIMGLRPITYHLDIENLNKFIYGDSKEARIMTALARAEGKDNELMCGFVAQEVDSLVKALGYDSFYGVDRPDNNLTPYALRYSIFVVPLVKAVQQQQKTIEQQQNLINQLIKRQEELEQEVQRLKQMNR